jgi:diguanylate cyclase (GGDEF)-like protein
LIFAIASIRFTAQADRTGEALLRWLGAGMALAAFSRFNYFLFPSIYSSFIYTGDLIRLGFYLCLLVGASAEVRQYWQRLEEEKLERDRLIGELRELSLVDPLTGLSNRRGFFAVANQELVLHARTGAPIYGVYMDVNRMKSINDDFGHKAGDEALRVVAAMLRSSFRGSDLIARIGGDEFCALTVEGGPQPAIERLRAALAARRSGDSAPYRLGLSIGIAKFDPAHHSSVEDLLAEADRSMYEEKERHSRESREIPE